MPRRFHLPAATLLAVVVAWSLVLIAPTAAPAGVAARAADPVPAAAARFSDPAGLALAPDGTLYVADGGGNRIRRVAPDGTTSTFAGSGVRGRDDGPATEARFDRPGGLAFGPNGTLYVADSGNDLIRAIAPDGSVTTVAGSGEEGRVDGRAVDAAFNSPRGIAVDAAGVIYIADRGNHTIRRLSADGAVTTLAGTGEPGFADGPGATAQFYYPGGVALGADGTIYVADEQNLRIRRLAPDGAVSTFAGSGENASRDGSAAAASFSLPTGLATGSDGTLYVVEQSQHVRAVRPDGTVTTIAGSGIPGYADGPAATAQFAGLTGIAVAPDGTLYLSDQGNHRIRAVAADGSVRTVAGSGDAPAPRPLDGPAATARFLAPVALAVDAGGAVYIADADHLRVLSGDGVVRTIAGPFTAASGVAVGAGGTIYVSDAGRQQIYTVGADGEIALYAGSGEAGFADGPAATAQFNRPAGLAAGPDGTLYVADTGNNRVRAIAPDGTVRTVAGTGERGRIDGPAAIATLSKPSAVALAPDGSLYVADSGNDQIRRVDPDGDVTSVLNGEGDEESPVNDPAGVAVGADGTLYISDTSGCRIGTAGDDGSFVVLAGSGAKGFADGSGSRARFFFPAGLAVAPDGTLYVADPNNGRLRAVSADGDVSTLAGSGISDE